MRRIVSVPVFVGLVALAACAGAPDLDTRTFELEYLDTQTAHEMIVPYVYTDRPDAPGRVSRTPTTITVRETPDNLERIARVLDEFDRPKPWVRLHFQIIEANGAPGTDERIAEVETELRKLFRFESYSLVDEAYVSGAEHSEIIQQVGAEEDGYFIVVQIGDVRAGGDSGIVELQVDLRTNRGQGLGTRINAREGRTVVLGNAKLTSSGGTTILTVRPELMRD